MTKKPPIQMVQLEWHGYVCGIVSCICAISIHGRVYLNWNDLKRDEAKKRETPTTTQMKNKTNIRAKQPSATSLTNIITIMSLYSHSAKYQMAK